MIITDEQIEEALNYLSESDETFAKAKKTVESWEKYVDLLKSSKFLDSEGNVEERKATAKIDEEVKQAQRKYLEALENYELIKNKRDTAQVYIWTWKTLQNSNRVSV